MASIPVVFVVRVQAREDPKTTTTNVASEEIPEISIQEIKDALKMENRKCPGEDRITSEMLEFGGNVILKALEFRFNKCLEEVDTSNIENDRPVSLLSHIYKLFTKIWLNELLNSIYIFCFKCWC